VAEGGAAAATPSTSSTESQCFEYNFMATSDNKVSSSEALSSGPEPFASTQVRLAAGSEKGTTVGRFINDKQVGEGRVDRACLHALGGNLRMSAW